ncbi:MAG: ATPase, partial [Paludibacteraceae bacterium]|nr:ATPase [Paludibacteraceae bacterium]
GKDYYVHSALTHFVTTPDYQIREAIVLSNEREVKQDGKIIYLPIYYTMFLHKSTVEEIILPAV